MHDHDAAPESWPCELCGKPSRLRVHAGCQAHIDENLAALPGLYRQLEAALHPGRRGGDGRNASRTAPLPCNLDALDLRARGGIEGIVGGWARDLCERENWAVPEYGSVEAAVEWCVDVLRKNLNTICDEHPAVKEMASEIRQAVAQARRLVTGERPERRIPLVCATDDCGTILRITLSTDGRRCPGCDRQYGREELLELQPAERTAA